MIRSVLVLALAPLLCNAQVNKDSLRSVFNDTNRSDSIRLEAIYDLAWDGYLYSETDSAIYYAQLQIDFSKESNIVNYHAKGISLKAIAYRIKGDLDKAEKLYYECIEILKTNELKEDLSKVYNNLGNLFYYRSNYPKAIELFFESLEIKEELNDTASQAVTMNNIASIYYSLGDYEKSKSLYFKSKNLSELMKDSVSMANSYNNLGLIYGKFNELDSAHYFYDKSLQLRKKYNLTKQVAESYNNLGNLLKHKLDTTKALEYYEKALATFEEIDDKQGIASCEINIGDIYFRWKDYKTSMKRTLRGYRLASQMDNKYLLKSSSKILYRNHKALNNIHSAFSMLEQYIDLRDTLENEENTKEILNLSYQYEYEKKSLADSIKNEEKKKLLDAQLELQKTKNEQQKAQKTYLYISLFGALIVILFIGNRFYVAKKQNLLIKHQKDEVTQAHEQLGVKTKELQDSIVYAKRIQQAILPPRDVMNKHLGNGFVIFEPKDVVSGDFYWLEILNPDSSQKTVYFAVADCTGHGVPGAMVSVICSNSLTKALVEEGNTDVGKILDRTRELVVQRLAKGGGLIKDGMDISLAALRSRAENENEEKCSHSHSASHSAQWAGANNPLWIIRKGATEVEEIKANKQPIGVCDNPEPYTTHEVNFSEGDTLYIFSDGFADQFGGEENRIGGKKFKTKNFKQLLLSIQHLEMEEQKDYIQKAFHNWKGELEQVDDVCIIGVRL